MAYPSIHTGAQLDAAVSRLNEIEEIRQESNANLATVEQVAGQVETNAQAAVQAKNEVEDARTQVLTAEALANQSAMSALDAANTATTKAAQTQADREAAQLAASQAKQIALGNAIDDEHPDPMMVYSSQRVQEGFNAFGDATDPDKGAAMVEAAPLFDGAPALNLRKWMREGVIDVRQSFGFHEDNSPDSNTDKLQSAIQEMRYHRGAGQIRIQKAPAPYYLGPSMLGESYENGGAAVASSSCCIVQRSGIILVGDGAHLRADGAGDLSLIYLVSPEAAGISGLHLDGGWSVESGTGAGHGIFQLQESGLSVCSGVHLSDLLIENVASYGIGLQSGDLADVALNSIHIRRTGADGIDIKQRGPNKKNAGVSLSQILVEDFGNRLDGQAGIDAHGIVTMNSVHVMDFGRVGIESFGVRLRTMMPPSEEGETARGSSVVGFTVATKRAVGNTYNVAIGSHDCQVSNGFTEGGSYGVFIGGNENGVPNRCTISNVNSAGASVRGFHTAGVGTRYVGCVATGAPVGFRNEGVGTTYIGCGADSATKLSTATASATSQTILGCDFGPPAITQVQTGNAAVLTTTGTASNIDVEVWGKGAGAVTLRSNSARALAASCPAGAANWMGVSGSVAGSPVLLTATGSDADVNLQIRPKGAGRVGVLINNVKDYADDAAAAAGGVGIGDLYRSGSTVKIRVT